MLVYRLGSFRRALPAGLLRKSLAPLSLALERRIRNRYGIELKSTASVGRRVYIPHQGGIVIHGYAVIGDGCTIRQGVTIGNALSYSTDKRPTLGCDVSLGAGAVIYGDCRIGDGARIGPNAVVSTDVANGMALVAPRSVVISPS